MKELHTLTAADLSAKIKNNDLDRDRVSGYFKERIARCDRDLKSFVSFFDPPLKGQGDSPLSGVPIAIKDNICVKGQEITCASRILKGHRAVYDATVISRLKQAGLVLTGTTNMDEFAFGSSTESSCYGSSRNPWDLSRVPGGSSGGSAAAVAGRLVPLALGSDTGGSIRQPASFCGVVGFKPTYGRISRFGLVAFGSSLDQIGPFTTNFKDCAYLLNILCGRDPADSTSAGEKVPDFSRSLVKDVKGLRIGLPGEYFQKGLDPEVNKAITETVNLFKDQGAKFQEISLPHTKYAVAAYYIVACSEASSNLQRFDGIKYGLRKEAKNLSDLYKETKGAGFGPEAKRRIFLGTYSLSSGYYDAYYLRALKVRTLIKQDFEQAFKEVDLILTPTAPTTAFKQGEKLDDPLSMYLSDIYTISANLAGVPGVSFPCGFDRNKLPIGAQFLGKPFDEETMIRAGFTYQSLTDHHQKIPEKLR